MTKKSATRLTRFGLACLISAASPAVFPAFAQNSKMVTQPSANPAGRSYADIADMADKAPLVATVRIRNIIVIKPEQAGNVPPGHKRLFVEADVSGLIRGEAGISPLVTYLYDAPTDAKGRVPKLKKAQMIVFARADGMNNARR